MLKAAYRSSLRLLPPEAAARVDYRIRNPTGAWSILWPLLRRERLKFAMSYLEPQILLARSWARSRSESSNFMYGLTELNRLNLTHLLAMVLDASVDRIAELIREIETDDELRRHVRTLLSRHLPGATSFSIGRRLGWYVIARVLKPKLVVETGVDYGLGACVLSAALLRNAEEGSPGHYIGTELRENAGQIYVAPYNTAGHIAYGDSLETLAKLNQPIDLFINDSDHSIEYEAREYECISSKLSPDAIVLGDNSHCSPALADFSEQTGRRFVFFKEEPLQHWYPGAGIGISLPPRKGPAP